MPKTKLKEDSHGFYFKTNGHIYRPQQARFSESVFSELKADPSRFSFGEEVFVSMVSSSSLARIKKGELVQLWHAHGEYIGERDTNAIWDPEPPRLVSRAPIKLPGITPAIVLPLPASFKKARPRSGKSL